ncbi:MAG TPA: biotin/lipoyl-binding protein, partial [Methylomirabilota bacterium]|nr:biotin/lipoyl-binding protein [Methylomirabilota bacterium]
MPEPDTVEQSDLLKQLHIDRGPDRPPRRRGRLLAILALILLAGSVGLWLGWSRLRPPVVQTTVARAAAPGGGAGSVLDASGYVTARLQATVSAKITGKVTEVLIEEGMRVREGAVLARLDDTEARAQLVLARAQLAAARSQEGEIRAMLAQTERDYTRQQELYSRQLVPAHA